MSRTTIVTRWWLKFGHFPECKSTRSLSFSKEKRNEYRFSTQVKHNANLIDKVLGRIHLSSTVVHPAAKDWHPFQPSESSLTLFDSAFPKYFFLNVAPQTVQPCNSSAAHLSKGLLHLYWFSWSFILFSSRAFTSLWEPFVRFLILMMTKTRVKCILLMQEIHATPPKPQWRRTMQEANLLLDNG